jgi:hypothetical protein
MSIGVSEAEAQFRPAPLPSLRGHFVRYVGLSTGNCIAYRLVCSRRTNLPSTNPQDWHAVDERQRCLSNDDDFVTGREVVLWGYRLNDGSRPVFYNLAYERRSPVAHARLIALPICGGSLPTR